MILGKAGFSARELRRLPENLVPDSAAAKRRSSEIELHFKTAQRKGLGISLLGIADKFVFVTGTFQEPRAAIDAKGLLLPGVPPGPRAV